MTDYQTERSLYRRCGVVHIDGCDDCTVQVCLENCPKGTEPYIVRFDNEMNCNSDNVIMSLDTESSELGEGVSECYERCEGAKGCNMFHISKDFSACGLYTTCDLDYHDDSDGGG